MDVDNIRGIFFDLHGTIILSPDLPAAWARWLTALHSCMVRHGLSMPVEEFAPCIEIFFERPSPDFADEGLSLYERRLKDLGRRLGLNLDNNTLRAMVNHTIAAWYDDMYVDPEAYDVLGVLKSRFKIGLVTNWDYSPSIYRLLADYELEGHFEIVVVSDEVGVAKPDPRIFHIALERAGLEPTEAIYVGDAPEDVEGSLAAGLHPILIKRPQKERHREDIEIPSKLWDRKTIEPNNLTTITTLLTLLQIFPPKEGFKSNRQRRSSGKR
ncbi:MAG: HAD family hydrolase [Candidatus Bathyarchaeota archaeon]|nr:HAD family hydrolase [Candidatus Bathyarchaeota archaeon]